MKKSYVKTTLVIILAIGGGVCCSKSNASEPKQEQVESAQNMNNLYTLAQHEIDAWFLFGQAIENVKNLDIQVRLTKFRIDCEKNIKALHDLLHKYGKKAPEHTKDFKGYFMQGYQAMRGLTSDQGLMKALHTNLQRLIHAYEDVLNQEMPADAKERVNQLYNDAKNHQQYVASKTQ